MYCHCSTNLLAGEFEGTLRQASDDPEPQRQTSFRTFEIVPILELEAGIGWRTRHFRVSAGYQISAWFNVLTVNEFSSAVRTNRFYGLGDTAAFDGLNVRVETRF